MTVIAAISLLHFLWQGALIGGAAWIAMKIARSASARYAIGVGALLLMAMAPVATAVWVRDTAVQGPESRVQGPTAFRAEGPEFSVPASTKLVPDPGPRTLGPGPSRTLDPGRWTLDHLRRSVRVSPTLANWLLGSWLLGVGLLSVRLSFGWWTVRRLTRTAVREPGREILSNAERLIAALNISGAVTVLESALVPVPTAMGWLKPVVLLPVQAMSGLSMAQIDALVAHELAHIKRHDYLVNLFQSAIETLLFYHPAVWLISRRVRHERELCCDDLAIAACGDDRLTYASALADLESMRQVPAPMLAANGGSLLTRMKRILGNDEAAVTTSRTNWTAGVAILLTALILVPVNVATTRATEQTPAARGVKDGVSGGATAAITRGVVGGVASGVVGGTANGVKGSVTGGVAGGIAGGLPSGIVGGVEAGATSGAKREVAAAPVSQQPVRVGGNIAPPERIKYVQPAYPQAAKDAHVSGIVIAEIVVGEDGRVSDARILRSIALLDDAALDAVKQWRYTPTMLNGQPVPVIITVTVNFKLADTVVGNALELKSTADVSVTALQDEPVSWNGREVLKIGGTVKSPERVRYVAPVYPQDAQAAHVTRIVIIQAVIDETGHVVATKVLRSIALLDQAAIDAVSQWVYTPTLVNGVAVPVVMTVTVNFTVQSQK